MRAYWELQQVESCLDICSRRRTRCTVTTAPDVDDGTRHPQLQPALSSAGTDEWVLSWRLNEESDSSGESVFSYGDRRAVGSRFQVLRPFTAKLRWPRLPVRVIEFRDTGWVGLLGFTLD